MRNDCIDEQGTSCTWWWNVENGSFPGMWDRYKLSQLNFSQINLLLMKNDRSHECGTDTNLSQINVSQINTFITNKLITNKLITNKLISNTFITSKLILLRLCHTLDIRLSDPNS